MDNMWQIWIKERYIIQILIVKNKRKQNNKFLVYFKYCYNAVFYVPEQRKILYKGLEFYR